MRRSIAPGMAEGPRAPAGLRGARAMNIAAWSGAGCGRLALGAATGTGLILLLAGTWWRVLGPGHAVLEAVAIAPGVVTALAGLAEDVLLLQIVAPGTDGEDLRRADLVGAASWLTRIKLAALA